MPKKSSILTLSLVSVLTHSPFAEDRDSIEFSRPVIKMSQEVVRVQKGGHYIASDHPEGLNGAMLEPTTGSVSFVAKKNERLSLEVMLAGTYFNSPYHNDIVQNFTRNISLSAPRLDMSYIFGDVGHPSLKVDVGIFAYKYDEYARNLGEYLFRTSAYPGIIQTGGTFGYIGQNGASLTGLKLSQSFGMFSHDLILSSETEMTPIYDLNLTYMAKFNFHDVLKIGGGVEFARLIRAEHNPKMTMKYFEYNGKWYLHGSDANGGFKGSSFYGNEAIGYGRILADTTLSAADRATLEADSVEVAHAAIIADSVGNNGFNPDMKTFDASAMKPVLYFSFDPKPLLSLGMLGPKDLVLYGETAILGVKSYPVLYDNLQQRMPVMIGLNVPTFKLLDVLSLEMEYYNSPWPGTYPGAVDLNALPIPYTIGIPEGYYAKDWKKDNFKWSIYAEKTLVRGLSIAAQAASDHSRVWDWNAYGKNSWEVYTSPSQWYWGLRLNASI